MTKKKFHDCLFENVHREPFRPFVVELRGGRRIVIKQPPVVWDDGAATFIDPVEDVMIEFFHNQVKEFALLEQESNA